MHACLRTQRGTYSTIWASRLICTLMTYYAQPTVGYHETRLLQPQVRFPSLAC